MKAIFALALVMLFASPALAQPPQKQNEVFLGIGDGGVIFMLEDVATSVGLALIGGGGRVTYGDQQGGFQIVAGYQRLFRGRLSAGVTASWAGSSKTVFLNGEDSGKIERQMLTLMADGRAHWLRRPVWDVYSGISAGISHFSDEFLSVSADDDGTFNGFAFQLIPIGVRLGRHTGGFFETGFGTNGFVKVGLSQRF